jgi:hypothetical protein
MRSIPSFVTCIFSLLLSNGREGQVLESLHLRFEKPEIDRGRSPVVLGRGLARSFDAKDRHPPAVHTPQRDVLQLSAADEHEGAEEKIVGLDQGSTSCSRTRAGPGFRPERRRFLWMEWKEIDYSEESRWRILFLIPGSAPGVPPESTGAGPFLS